MSNRPGTPEPSFAGTDMSMPTMMLHQRRKPSTSCLVWCRAGRSMHAKILHHDNMDLTPTKPLDRGAVAKQAVRIIGSTMECGLQGQDQASDGLAVAESKKPKNEIPSDIS